MAVKTPKSGKSRVPKDSYLELILTYPLKSLRTNADLRTAQKVLDELTARPRLDAGQMMYLDALSDLVEVYEDDHFPIPSASDADMLAHLMEARGGSQADIHRGSGISKSVVSEILSGKRSLNRKQIEALAMYLDVEPGVFLARS